MLRFFEEFSANGWVSHAPARDNLRPLPGSFGDLRFK